MTDEGRPLDFRSEVSGGLNIQAGGNVHLYHPTPAERSLTFSLQGDNTAFTGRARQLAAFDEMVRAEAPDKTALIVAIDGMPGVGKTALALHFAHRLTERFGDRVLQVDLYGHTAGRAPAQPADVLTGLLRADGVSPTKLPTDLDDLAAMWRDRLAGKRVLLLLDNAFSTDQVRPLLPGAPGHVVLITSRRRLVGLRGAFDARLIPLEKLGEEEAVELLERLADRPARQDGQASAAALAKWCGYLPLAITLVAAGMQSEPDATFASRLAELSEFGDPLKGLDAFDDEGEQGAPQGVVAAFELSYRRLPDGRRRVLRRLGLTPGLDVDAYAAAALTGLPVDAARDHLRMLHNDRLVERDVTRYAMHDLIRAYARHLVEEDDPTENAAAVERLMAYYAYTLAFADPPFSRQPAPTALPGLTPSVMREFANWREASSWARTELRNVLACAEHAGRQQLATWVIRFAAAAPGILRNDGLWKESVALQTRAIEAARLLDNPLAEANALHELGLLHRLIGEVRVAAEHLEQALGIYRRVGEERGAAHAANNLGVVLEQSKDSSGAKVHLDQALDGYRSLGDRLGEANVLHDLAIAQRFLGDLPVAAELGEQALALYRAVGNQLGEAHALRSLATVERGRGDLGAAVAHLESARVLYHELGNQLGEANTVAGLGTAWRLAGDHAKTIAYLEQSLVLNQRLGNRRGVANTLAELGAVHRAAGDRSAARQSLRQALGLCRELGSLRDEALVQAELERLDEDG